VGSLSAYLLLKVWDRKNWESPHYVPALIQQLALQGVEGVPLIFKELKEST